MNWKKVGGEGAVVDPQKGYLVRTDGDKWGEASVLLWPGYVLLKALEPNGGKPMVLWFVEVTDPEGGRLG